MHPSAVFAHNRVDERRLADSLMRLGAVGRETWRGDSPERAPRRPRPPARRRSASRPGEPWDANAGETLERRARRLVDALDRGGASDPGPARLRKDLPRRADDLRARGRGPQGRQSRRPSHKVIRNLLDASLRRGEGKQTVRVVQKVREDDVDSAPRRSRQETENGRALDALAGRGSGRARRHGVALGSRRMRPASRTCCSWTKRGRCRSPTRSRSRRRRGAWSCSATRSSSSSRVQGSHPDGTAVSALHHVLAGAQTLPDDRGLFLPETWRMHPRICAFTSEVFYEGRLSARAELERQRIEGAGDLDGAGLWLLPVDHEGNQNSLARGSGCRRGARVPAARRCGG